MHTLSRAATLAVLFAVLLSSTAAPLRAQGPDTTPPAFLSSPVFTPSNKPNCPLVARLQFTTDEPASTEIVLLDGVSANRLVAEPGLSIVHDVTVAGMRPNTSYTIRMAVRDAAGNVAVWPAAFHMVTPPLPSTFPPLHTTVSAPASMEPGITLFAAFFSSPVLPGSGAFIIAVDETGAVVWYYFTRDRISNVERMSNGNLLALFSPFQAQEIDLRGNIVRRWWAQGGGVVNKPPGAIVVATDQFHHEFHELQNDPNADFLALSTEIRQYPNYPINEIDTSIIEPVANVAGEVIVEFRADGTVVRETKLLDILDPYRICYGSLAGFYDNVYGLLTKDWAHANSVIIDENDDTYVVSLRHQDCIVKIRRKNGQLVWIHGAWDRWLPPWSTKLLFPIGANFGWHYHQHGPHMDADGTLTLFDNGNYRTIPPVPFGPVSTFYSRAVKYNINPVLRTTEQVWEYRGPVPWFSGFLGDCDPLPVTGNVLITDGAKQVTGMNKTFARMVEVTGTLPGGKVFEILVNDPMQPTPNPYNWNVYRSQRWADIYARP